MARFLSRISSGIVVLVILFNQFTRPIQTIFRLRDHRYYNAGERPTTEILFHHPELVNRTRKKWNVKSWTLNKSRIHLKHIVDLDSSSESAIRSWSCSFFKSLYRKRIRLAFPGHHSSHDQSSQLSCVLHFTQLFVFLLYSTVSFSFQWILITIKHLPLMKK